MTRLARALSAAATLLCLSAAAQAETFGAWEARQVDNLYVAQTKSPSMALFFVCAPGRPGVGVHLVTDAPVPAYGDLAGPVASFVFDGGERLRFGAAPNADARDAGRVFRVQAERADLDRLLAGLKRADRVGVTMIGGQDPKQPTLARGVLSLRGSAKALSELGRRCS